MKKVFTKSMHAFYPQQRPIDFYFMCIYNKPGYLIMKYFPLGKSSKRDQMLKETGETLKFLFLMNEMKPNLPQKDQIQPKSYCGLLSLNT